MCSVWGTPSYTSEIDFRDETEPDCLQFSAIILAERFNHIRDHIRSPSFHGASLRVGGVRGFYSGWSPSITTNAVKILANVKDQRLEIEEGCTVTPPVLGQIDTFSFNLTDRVVPQRKDAD